MLEQKKITEVVFDGMKRNSLKKLENSGLDMKEREERVGSDLNQRKKYWNDFCNDFNKKGSTLPSSTLKK